MAEWIRLDTSRLNSPQPAEIRGVLVKVLLSPHDVPLAVRSEREAKTSDFVIEFKYIDDELLCRMQQGDIILLTGRYSGRLFSIRIPANVLPPTDIQLQIGLAELVGRAMDGYEHTGSRRAVKDNLRVTKEAIVENEKELLTV